MMDHEAKTEPVALSDEETAVLPSEKQEEVEKGEEIVALKQQSQDEGLDDAVVDVQESEAVESEEASVEEATLPEDSEEAEDEEEGSIHEQEVGKEDVIDGQEVRAEAKEHEVEEQERAAEVEEQLEIVEDVEESREGATGEEEDGVGNQETVEDTKGEESVTDIQERVEGATSEEERIVEAQETVEEAEEAKDEVEKRGIAPVVVAVPSKVRRKRRLHPVMNAFLLFLAIILGGGGIIGVSYYYHSVRQPLSTFVRPVDRNPTPGMTPTSGYESIQGRSFNLLLLGSDDDAKYAFPAVITQVMMIVRVDTVTKTVTMVSIPRDSWVRVPEAGGMHKIGQAFLLGAITNNNSFEGGVRLARMTVEQNYGVPIDRYAWVGLSGFAKVIDRLGGVDVDVLHPIVDDTYPDDVGNVDDPNSPYGYKRIYIPPGPQRLNGHEALEYVRSRHSDLIGDIGRTHRQQQVLEALKGKLNVGNLIGRMPELLEDLTGSVYTDLTEDEMIALAYFGRELGDNSIKRITLGFDDGERNYGQGTSLYDPWAGAYQYVILPNCEAIEPVVNEIFGLGDADSCNVRG